MNIYLLLFLDICSVVVANLLLKKGTAHLKELTVSTNGIIQLITDIIKNPYIIIGLSCYGFSFLMWILVLSKVKLIIAYPISTSLAIALIAITSFIFYKESVSLLQIGGIAIIILGIFVLLFTK